MKTYSGFTAKTPEHLLLDAGAYFKNFQIDTDTFDSAVLAGKLIGATRDGGEFNAVPSISQIGVDGVKGRAKGLELLDNWDIDIKANVLEIKRDVLTSALCTGEVDTETNENYDIITARNNIELDDYIENITWVGTLSGSDEPVIIQIYNALDTDGLKVSTKDKNQSVVTLGFYAHYTCEDLNTPPFAIYYPKSVKDK